MASSAAYASLFSSFDLGPHRLKNRVVHAAMNTHMAASTRVTQHLVDYHAARARGGAAMIVTEPISMARHQNVSYRARAWNDDDLDGLKRWADAVESEDCRLLGQIQDPGRGRHNSGIGVHAIGASALPDDLSWTVPRVLAAGEIRAMIAEFAESARRLQCCGWSGVEISAGHGHLFHQFLSPWSNERIDEYGGDWEGRTRFLRELVAALRSACGRSFLVGVKLPSDDWVEGGIGPAEAAIVTRLVVASGEVDFVSYCQGTHGLALERHLPDGHVPELPYHGLEVSLRPALNGVPLVALGKITRPEDADRIVANGEAELIGLGRGLLADPAWPRKAAAGRTDEIRPCVLCNLCWDTINTQLDEMNCIDNPRVATPDEADWKPAPAATKRRIAVVGAGVAGLEAAWVAAARGHDVTVFHASRVPGGSLALHARMPGSAPLAGIVDYQSGTARRAGVRFESGVEATAADLVAARFDAVILAAGSRMLRPPRMPRTATWVPDLRTALRASLDGRAERCAGAAVIYDMDHTEGTYAAAEWLRQRYERVVVITPREYIAQKTAIVMRQGIVRRFKEQRIEVFPLVGLRWTDLPTTRIEYQDLHGDGGGEIADVAFIAYATPRVPTDALAEPLRAAGVEVHLVGDCALPRGVFAATSEGHAAGNAV